MTRTVLVVGLMLLAALLPLAAMPLPLAVVVDSLPVVGVVVPFTAADAQPVALLALAYFRAPPSR